MCKKDSNPQASHSVRKLSTLSRECEPWNRSNDVQWCPSHELVRAPLCPLFGCLCDSFGCYRFLSPSYPTLVPRRSLDQIVRGSCCGNTSPLLLLVTLWECYLSFNCCNWHFVWVPSCLASKCSESKSLKMHSRAGECSCRLNSNTGMHDFWPRSFESPSRWPSQALCASWCLALGVS